MSDESQSKKPLVLPSKTEIFSPPHKYLNGKQVFFTLPRGWVAEDTPANETDFPKGWWIKNWNATGLFWEISRLDVTGRHDPPPRPRPTGERGQVPPPGYPTK